MKKINYIYISILLIIAFVVICLNMPIFNNKNNIKDYPVSVETNDNKIVYLTFDDGPSENTIKILDILERYEIQATFFVVGPSYKLKNDLLREIVTRGHSLAIHSYSHEYSKIYSDKESYIADFYDCLNWIKLQTNITPTLYRFPGGSSTTITTKNNIISIINTLFEQGYKHVDWNVDSYDSHYNTDSKAIINSVINRIVSNEKSNVYFQNILMHDNSKKIATINSLPSIIEYCLSKGYIFKSLEETSPLYQHVKRAI